MNIWTIAWIVLYLSKLILPQDSCRTFEVNEILLESCDSFIVFILLEVPSGYENEHIPYTFVVVEKREAQFSFEEYKTIEVGDIICINVKINYGYSYCSNARIRNKYVEYYKRITVIEDHFFKIEVCKTNDIVGVQINKNKIRTRY